MNDSMDYNFIAIEGNIGAGKTTLATKLSEQFNAKLILERFADNSFLPKFYKEPEKYAFPLEMSFLADRYQQLKDQLTARDLFKTFTVADYFIDKSLIFSRNNLQRDEFALYSRLFVIINSQLPKPDMIVYIYRNVKQLQENIRRRGRDYEQEINDDYLDGIQQGYLNYFRQLSGIRILIIDSSEIDFVARESDYNAVVDLISGQYLPGIHYLSV